MEANEIVTYIIGGLLTVAAFFIRKVLADVERLKRADLQHQLAQQKIETNTDHIQRNEETMFKKFANLHTKNDKQDILNTEFQVLFARLEEKQDQILNLLKDKK